MGDGGSFHALQLDGESRQSLIKVVMQFARDPLAFLFLGLEQLPRQGFQLPTLFAKQEDMMLQRPRDPDPL